MVEEQPKASEASPSKTAAPAVNDFADDDDDDDEEKQVMTEEELFDNLLIAVKENNPEEMEHWISQNPNIVQRPDKNGWTPV